MTTAREMRMMARQGTAGSWEGVPNAAGSERCGWLPGAEFDDRGGGRSPYSLIGASGHAGGIQAAADQVLADPAQLDPSRLDQRGQRHPLLEPLDLRLGDSRHAVLRKILNSPRVATAYAM